MYSFTYTLRDVRDGETFEITCTEAELASLLKKWSFYELAEEF